MAKQNITIYHFDPITNEAIGSDIADLDPLENNPMIPGFATLTAPPATITAGKVAVFDVATDTWAQVEDHRGKVYDTATATESMHTDLGVLPANLTTRAPTPNCSWDDATKVWVFDILKASEASKLRISEAYQTAIAVLTQGYTDAEQKTWQTQLVQAKAFAANKAAATPALDALCAARGATKAVIAPMIIAKAEALELASLGLTGKYQKLIADIDVLAVTATTTQTDVDAIKW